MSIDEEAYRCSKGLQAYCSLEEFLHACKVARDVYLAKQAAK